MCFWTVLFIEFWKRETSRLQYEWDTVNFEKKMQPIRPEYESKAHETKVKKEAKILKKSGSTDSSVNCFVFLLLFSIKLGL